MAKNAPRQFKGPYLIRASSHLEVTQLKMRTYPESGFCNETVVFQIQGKLSEAGRMLGGWMKANGAM